jgi:hypothetical protein
MEVMKNPFEKKWEFFRKVMLVLFALTMSYVAGALSMVIPVAIDKLSGTILVVGSLVLAIFSMLAALKV